jgi:hypothetical protein
MIETEQPTRERKLHVPRMYRHHDLFSRWLGLYRRADCTDGAEISPEEGCQDNHQQSTTDQNRP